MTTAEAHAVAVALDERIRALVHDVRWYASQPNPARWADLRAEAQIELRALLRLRREAKKATRRATRELTHGDHFAGMAS